MELYTVMTMNYNRENVDESYKNNVEQEKLSTNLHT